MNVEIRNGEPEAGSASSGTGATLKRGEKQQAAYARLKEMIVLQELPPGMLLSEVGLSRRLGIGKTPIRAALQRLSLEGLVTVLPQRGVLVTHIDVAIQLKLLEVRGELERLLTRGAASRATARQRTEMVALAESLGAAAATSDGRGFMNLLAATHALLAEAADNEILDNVMSQVFGLSRRFWFANYEKYGSLHRAAVLHGNRLRAVAEGDVAKAAAASDTLVSYLEAFTRATIGHGNVGAGAAG